MISTEVPINGANMAIPSVRNASSYQAYFTPGGKLLSGGTEMTIKPLSNVMDGIGELTEACHFHVDTDTGIKILIENKIGGK